jgi:hypothetical protein
MNERLTHRVATLAGRLADFLAASLPQAGGTVEQSRSFLRAMREFSPAPTIDDPLERLACHLSLSDMDLDLILLAGMADEHEGFAAVFRALHPRNESRPSTGLAAQLFGINSQRRAQFRELLETAPIAQLGILRIPGDGPFFDRSLDVAEMLWPVLHGADVWPSSIPRSTGVVSAAGLGDWLEVPVVQRAARAIAGCEPCTILVAGDTEDLALERALVLVREAGRTGAGFPFATPVDADAMRLASAHCLARQSVPVIRIPVPDGPANGPAPNLDTFPDTAVLCCRTGSIALRTSRPILIVNVERLTVAERRKMWQQTMPYMNPEFHEQASMYSIEPAAASELASDLECIARLETRACTVRDLTSGLRARTAVSQSAGVKIIHPRAEWKDLVLSRDREEQLRLAVERLAHQETVFDRWGFLKNRAGARGVRMLFSGPSGTGKTYSAEVLANALGVDLLLVDISRVVSKWIGETEKNLAAVFDVAERAQAVCFFDEADALFGKRTEVSDAHDRYANLETAYLLSRLERFEGLAILATNLRNNIDPAFLRRMEFIVDFEEPDREERFRLWRCQIPDEKLLARDVNLYEFAALYPVVGGFIKNAAVSAAFLAAADGGCIERHHFLRAIRREYDKSGKPFPGLPAGAVR